MDLTFHPSPPWIGVELELCLLDEDTLDLADEVMPLLEGFADDPDVKPEMVRCTVEVTSPPATSTVALEPLLLARLRAVRRRARDLGLGLCGVGVHPFSGREAAITPLPRFLEAERTGGRLARTAITCSTHVHLGMPSGEACTWVLTALRGAVPALLALGASSPLYQGALTGFCSYRQRLLASLRNYGVPPRFEHYRDVEEVFRLAEAAGIARSFRDAHWDLRPRPDFGTLELRVLDAQPTAGDSLALAALVHALAAYALEVEHPALPPPLPGFVERENAFRASLDGLDARLITGAAGETQSARVVLERLFSLAEPFAASQGTVAHLERAWRLLEAGGAAQRMRAALAEGRSPRALTRALALTLDEELGGALDMREVPVAPPP